MLCFTVWHFRFYLQPSAPVQQFVTAKDGAAASALQMNASSALATRPVNVEPPQSVNTRTAENV